MTSSSRPCSRRIAHALRTPLGVAQGVVRALDGTDEQTEQERRLLQMADRALGQIERMATRLSLEFGLREGRVAATPSPTLVGPLLDDARQDIARVRPRRAIVVATTAPPDLRIPADPGLLRHAIGELLDNAVRFARSEVRIEVDTRTGIVAVRVRNDGPGLAELGTVDETGLGLGLEIAEAIARLHAGSVGLEDGTEGRVTFVLTLPQG